MVVTSQHNRSDERGATSWDAVSEQSLVYALAPPVCVCVEAGTSGQSAVPPRRSASRRRLGLTVTAHSVYRHAIAKVFAASLQARLHLSADLRERVHTALQEALMNAMLHGNLGLDAGLRDNLQALATSHDIIESRFASEQIARSIIYIDATWTRTMLYVVVRDSGGGFNSRELPSPEERLAAGRLGSGRGLMILQSLCDRIGLVRGGTTIKLGFLLTNGPVRDTGCQSG